MRFSKSAALAVLDARAEKIAFEQKFDRQRGTAQLEPLLTDPVTLELIGRSVEYGRMRAFEQFAEAIEEGFRFEYPPIGEKS